MLGKAKKERVQWGFNPSPKIVPNKKKKPKIKKDWLDDVLTDMEYDPKDRG